MLVLIGQGLVLTGGCGIVVNLLSRFCTRKQAHKAMREHVDSIILEEYLKPIEPVVHYETETPVVKYEGVEDDLDL